MKIPFIKYSKIWLAIACATVVLSIAAVSTWGLKLGIDFTGGSLLEMSFEKNRPAIEDLVKTLEQAGIKSPVVQGSGENKVLIRSSFLSEAEHQTVVKKVVDTYAKTSGTVKEDRFETIGSSISNQLRQRALLAIILVNLGIIAYVAYSFRKVSRPVASWKYGLLAIVALVHDILLVVGLFAVLGKFASIEVDLAFVVALLTVLGYSVTDTIVVYDRIRENLLKTSETFAEVVNNGLNETLMRSINTTLTTLFPLFALFFLGGSSIKYFALALLVGIASGTFSSIFIASPLLVWVEKWQNRTKSA